MIIDEEVYLKHFGVKGMHWGVRHDPKSSSVRSLQRKRNFKRAAIAGGVIGIGALAVASMIHDHRATRVAQLQSLRRTHENITAAQKLVQANRLVKVSAIHKGYQVSRSGVATPMYRYVRG